MWYKCVNLEKFKSPETPIKSLVIPLKVLIFIIFTLTTLHELKAIKKLDSTSALGLPLVMWYEALYIYETKVFKNGPSKICGRQPLKILK